MNAASKSLSISGTIEIQMIRYKQYYISDFICIQIVYIWAIYLYSADPVKKCCKEIGVPEICYRYCIEKSSGGTRFVPEKQCENWFGRIGACQQGW